MKLDLNTPARPKGLLRTGSRPHVHALLGLPFDLLTVPQACEQILNAIAARQSLFLTTPNVNFVAACVSNPVFRDSVIDSHCVVVDGMPLVWLGRWLGLPVPERVAGSSVFERLQKTPPVAGRKPIRVYFFGGAADVARLASVRINADPVGMVCVGYTSPGFGTIESMSTQDILDDINAARPDFLVVALGAAKGQAWIQHNRGRLNAPVISHLGAVVNFSSRQIRRAPPGWQRFGMEWLWRIKEEPYLWRRYAIDASILLRLIVSGVLPAKWHRLIHPRVYRRVGPASIKVHASGEWADLHLSGLWNQHALTKWEDVWYELAPDLTHLTLNLSQVTAVDSAFLGRLLQLLHTRRALGLDLQLLGASHSVRRQMRHYGVEYLLDTP